MGASYVDGMLGRRGLRVVLLAVSVSAGIGFAPAFAQSLGDAWTGPTESQMPPPPQYGGAPLAQGGGGQGGGSGMSAEEAQMRAILMQRSMGFGGIFGPGLNQWANTPSQPDPCGAYSDYAACQAHKNGDNWAADRLQNNRSNGAERDWYGR